MNSRFPIRAISLAICTLLLGACVSNPPAENAKSDVVAESAPPAPAKPVPTPVPVASATAPVTGKGTPALTSGLDLYSAGKYPEAQQSLKFALKQGLTSAQQINAYKYLAFIDCAAGRKPACRDNFARALKIDPAMELTPAEVGHPLWGPVFKELKTKLATKPAAKSAAKPTTTAAPATKPAAAPAQR